MQDDRRKFMLLVTGAVLVIVLLFGAFAVLQLRTVGKVHVDIETFPSDATLTIDGQPAKSGKTWLKKGKHTLKATRQFFGPVTQDVDTATLDLKTPVYLITDPNTAEAADFLAKHPAEQTLLEQARGTQFSQTQDRLLERYPIITKLPYSAIDYMIYYTVDEKKNITIVITVYPVSDITQTSHQNEITQFKNEALGWLATNGLQSGSVPVTIRDGSLDQ